MTPAPVSSPLGQAPHTARLAGHDLCWPTCAARPILDLTVGVTSEGAHRTLIGLPRAVGPVRGDSGAIPGRRDDADSRRTHQASVGLAGGRLRFTHLAFRDARREDAVPPARGIA